MSHLSDETFVDLLDGTVKESETPHLLTCAECRTQLADLRQTMTLAMDAEVPEPSPLFWEHMAARVRADVDAQRHTAAASRGLVATLFPAGVSWWGIGGLVGVAAAALLAVFLQTSRNPVLPTEQPAAAPMVSVAESDGTVAAVLPEADETFGFVTDLASGVDWDAESNLGLAAPGAVDRSVAALNADERAELGRLLNDALRGGA